MGIFDKLLSRWGRVKTAPAELFSFTFGQSAPGMKAREYKQNYKGWVYACITAIADDVGSIKIHLQNKTKDGWKEVDNHPAVDLLTNVNPYYTSSDLFVETQSFLEIEGDDFWNIVYNANGKPLEIWPLDPSRMIINKDNVNFIKNYTYLNNGGVSVTLDPSEIIHFKRFNPIDPYRGIGTIQAAAMAIDIDNYSADWSRNFFFNSAQPNGVLTTPNKLDPEQADLVQKKWQAKYGGVENSNKVAVLHSGLDYKAIQLSQKDMDFLEQRKFSRDEILSLFRVPKSVVGITEDVNRANAEASDYIFAKRVVRPRMQFIIDKLNEFLLPLFHLNTNEWRYVFDNPVPENVELEIKEFQAGLTSGWLTINEVREEEGLEPIEGGDKVYLSALLAPLDELGANSRISPDGTPSGGPDPATPAPLPKGVKKKRFNGTQKKRRRTIQAQIRKYSPKYKDLILSFGKILAGELNSTKASRINVKEYQALNIFQKASYISIIALNQVDSKWKPEVVDLEDEAVYDNFDKGGLSEWETMGLVGDFDLKNPRAVRWMATRSMDNVTTIVNTLKDEARDIIANGLDQGMAYTAIADQIQQFVTDQSDWRADRIARTEVHSAYCGGRGEADRQSGLPLLKEWVVMDGGCCDVCQENADAGPIPFDDNFPSGDDLPSNHPNCRCDYNTTVDENADQG